MYEKLIHTKIGTIEIEKKVGKKITYETREVTLKSIFEDGVGVHANSKKFEARSVKFMTNDPRDFPLFQGYPWKVLSKDIFDKSKILLWLDHVANFLWNDNWEVYEYMINWIAFIVQKPGVKTTVAPMII